MWGRQHCPTPTAHVAKSSKSEGGEGRDSPDFGSKEGVVAILSLGHERDSHSSKMRDEVDGGGDSELEARGDSPASQPFTSSFQPFSRMAPGSQTKQFALMSRIGRSTLH